MWRERSEYWHGSYVLENSLKLACAPLGLVLPPVLRFLACAGFCVVKNTTAPTNPRSIVPNRMLVELSIDVVHFAVGTI